MGNRRPSKGSEEDVGVVCRMRGCIVHMNEVSASHRCSWPTPVVSSIESPEDGLKNLLVHCLGSLHKFIVKKSFVVKKRHNHDFGMKETMPGNLGAILLFALPLLALDADVRIIDVYPGFIHGNQLSEDSGTIPLQPDPKGTHIQAALQLSLIEYTRHKFCTPFDEI